MFLKQLLIILISVSPIFANATELTIKNGRKQFKLVTSDNEIIFKDHQVKLSLQKKNCNRDIYDNFIDKINAALKRSYISKTFKENSIQIVKDSESLFIKNNSKLANFLIATPDAFIKLKYLSKLLCKN